MLNISDNKKEKNIEKTPEKRNSLELDESFPYIQLRDGSYKKLRIKNYKEYYLDKIHMSSSPLSKEKNDNNSPNKKYGETFESEESLKNLKMIKSYNDDQSKNKRHINYADYVTHPKIKSDSNLNNIDINNNKKNNNYKNENNSFTNKKNVYVNDEVKEQIIRKALDNYNKSFNDLNFSINQNSENLSTTPYKTKSNFNLDESSSLKNLKKIQKIIALDTDKEDISEITNNTEDIITIYKDNFPYRKYEFENSRNYSINLTPNKKSNNLLISDLSFNNSLTLNPKRNYSTFNQINNLNQTTTIKNNTRSKTENFQNNKYHSKSYNNSFTGQNKTKKSKSNNNKFPTGFSIKNQEKLLKKKYEGIFDNKRAKDILNKYEYANYSSIEKGDNQESVYSTIPVLEDELINKDSNNKNINNDNIFINEGKNSNNKNKYLTKIRTNNDDRESSNNKNSSSKGSTTKYLKSSKDDTQNNTFKTSASKYLSNSQKDEFEGSTTKYLSTSNINNKNQNSSKYLNNKDKKNKIDILNKNNIKEEDDEINTDIKDKSKYSSLINQRKTSPDSKKINKNENTIES